MKITVQIEVNPLGKIADALVAAVEHLTAKPSWNKLPNLADFRHRLRASPSTDYSKDGTRG